MGLLTTGAGLHRVPAGGGPTTIFTDTMDTAVPAWGGNSVRDELPVTSGAQNQVRVTFKADVGSTFDTTHCSIGISTQNGTSSTTATPVELTFTGASGFSILANATITSDWANFSGFTTSDKLIVVMDVSSGGSGVVAYHSSGSPAGSNIYEKAASASWNTQTVSGYTPFAGLNGAVILIETQP